MRTYFQALLWAAIIILVALGSRFHLIPKEPADFLVLTLPVAAWLSIARRNRITCTTAEG
jgi:hypothetical protein